MNIHADTAMEQAKVPFRYRAIIKPQITGSSLEEAVVDATRLKAVLQTTWNL